MNTERWSMALISVVGGSWKYNKSFMNTTQVADKNSSAFPMPYLNKPAYVVFP